MNENKQASENVLHREEHVEITQKPECNRSKNYTHTTYIYDSSVEGI